MLGKAGAVLIIASLLLCACSAATPTPAPTPEPLVVKETVLVEKVVKETVEVQKVVTATPLPSEDLVTLDWNFGAQPATLDPALISDTDTVSPEVVENLFLGLTGVDAKGKVAGRLASSWSVNDTGMLYTFRLRKDVKWVRYNPIAGDVVALRPVTAQDVVYGIKRALNPKTGSKYAYVLYIIKGAETLHKADITKLSDDQLQKLVDGVSVRATDDYTLEIMLERPAGYFPTIVSMWAARPVPQEVVEQYGPRWIEAGFIVTNGPYVLADWFHGSHLTLLKNPKYYDADKVQIQKIAGVMVGDGAETLALYKANQLDAVTVPAESYEKLKSDAALSKEMAIGPHPCTYYYGFTNDKPPLDNNLVRRALSAAIDRKTLIQTVLKAGEAPANAFTAPNVFGSFGGDPDVAGWALDYKDGAAKAKQWLSEAGYPNGAGFPEITLMYNNDRDIHKEMAEAVAAMWKSTLGIKVKVEGLDWKTYLNTVTNKKTPTEKMPHVWRMGWCAEYPDANNWLNDVFNPAGRQNYIRWNDKQYQDVINRAERSKDPDERLALYKRAEQILVDEQAAIAPVYYYTTVSLTKPWLTRDYSELAGRAFFNWTIDWTAKKAAQTKP
jgi:oligopeptide transport system substrate-binding protein